MHFICNGLVFATKQEATQYRDWYLSVTRHCCGIFRTDMPVTHRFGLEVIA